MTEYFYRTVDFRPAPLSGWRALYLNREGGRRMLPVVGWLIQDEIEGDGHDETPTGDRRVIAAVLADECEVMAVSDPAISGTFWYVLDPGDPEPTPEEEAKERERQAAVTRTQARRRAEPTP